MIPQSLSQQDTEFLNRLSNIDFGPIAFKLMHPDTGKGWSIQKVTRAIEQYRRFLFLHHRHPTAELVPTPEIDQVWHTHILDTVKYRQDCHWLFDRFIDHYPYLGLGTDGKSALETKFSQTQTLFQQCFTD